MNLEKTLNVSSSSRGRWDDTTVITGRLARTKKLPILTDQHLFSRLRRQWRRGQVAKAMDCKSIIRGFESHRRLSFGRKPGLLDSGPSTFRPIFFFWALKALCVFPS